MRGPYPLSSLEVGMHVPIKIGGVFLLGKTPQQVSLVGRAEHDLRQAVLSHGDKYRFFRFEVAINPHEAWVLHCRLFHKYSDQGLDDTTHPPPPTQSITCPVCGK